MGTIYRNGVYYSGEEQNKKEELYTLPIASDRVLGGIKVGQTLTIDENGTLNIIPEEPYELPTASETTLGGIKIGDGLSINNGQVSVNFPAPPQPYELPQATATTLGGVKIGQGINLNNGVISVNTSQAAEPYTLPIASKTTLGGVKIGSGITINEDGIISTEGSSSKINLDVEEGLSIKEIENSELSDIPVGYSKISYIDSDSKSWILLDYIPTENTKVDMIYSVNEGMINKDAALFGSRNGSTASNNQFVFWSDRTAAVGNYFIFVYGGNTYSGVHKNDNDFQPTTKVECEQEIHAIVSLDGVFINGEKIQTVNKVSTPSPYKIGVCACATNNSGSTAYSPGAFKIYSMKIYENDELKLDLTPVLNKAMKPGLYDKVNDKMYISMTSADFLYDDRTTITNDLKYSIGLSQATKESLGGIKIGKGLEITNDGTLSVKNFSSNKYIEGKAIEFKEGASSTSLLPEEFQQLEYIEGTGSQYLVIPYFVKMEDTIEMEVYMTQGTSKWEWAFGSIHKTNPKINQCEWICRYNNTDGVIYYVRYDRIAHGESSLGSFPLFTKFKVTAYKENISLEFSPDNIRNYSSNNGMSGDAISHLMLFACNVSTDPEEDERFVGDGIGLAHFRLYSFRILDSNNNILYDMIPCKEKATGDIGIYNIIDDTFIKSKTSVNFIGGPNVGIDTSINVKYDPNTLAINENNELTVIGSSEGGDNSPYELPIASDNKLGGIKIGNGFEVNEQGELDLKIKIVPCTQEQYDALNEKDSNTLYLIGD